MSAPNARVLVNASQNSPNLSNSHTPFGSHSDLAKAAIANSPSGRAHVGRTTESEVQTNPGSDAGDDSRGSFKSWKRGEGLTPWEKDIVDSGEVRRKANVAQLCGFYLLQLYNAPS
jgi:cell cycle protein kinase DBF2